jgi:hypothetical protein
MAKPRLLDGAGRVWPLAGPDGQELVVEACLEHAPKIARLVADGV